MGGATASAPAPAGRIVATLDAGLRPCAMTAAAGSVCITAYGDGVLAQVDPATNTVTKHKIGVQPCGITYAGAWLWVAQLGTSDIARVSPKTRSVTKAIPLGGQAWDVQHSAGAVWVSDRTGNRVLRLDPHTGKITGGSRSSTRSADSASPRTACRWRTTPRHREPDRPNAGSRHRLGSGRPPDARVVRGGPGFALGGEQRGQHRLADRPGDGEGDGHGPHVQDTARPRPRGRRRVGAVQRRRHPRANRPLD